MPSRSPWRAFLSTLLVGLIVLRALVPLPVAAGAAASGPVIVLCGGGEIVWHPLGGSGERAPAETASAPCPEYAVPLGWLPSPPDTVATGGARILGRLAPLADHRPASARLRHRQARAPPAVS